MIIISQNIKILVLKTYPQEAQVRALVIAVQIGTSLYHGLQSGVIKDVNFVQLHLNIVS